MRAVWKFPMTGVPERIVAPAVADDEHYVGTFMDGSFVWHYYTTEPA
jgi:hypothetical protein